MYNFLIFIEKIFIKRNENPILYVINWFGCTALHFNRKKLRRLEKMNIRYF